MHSAQQNCENKTLSDGVGKKYSFTFLTTSASLLSANSTRYACFYAFPPRNSSQSPHIGSKVKEPRVRAVFFSFYSGTADDTHRDSPVPSSSHCGLPYSTSLSQFERVELGKNAYFKGSAFTHSCPSCISSLLAIVTAPV